ncbi:MAG: hypothetical protein QW294_07115 [Candidatus Bathyarchaeia archaeon]
MNPPNNARCECCGYILDRSLAMKVEEEERKREEKILSMLEETFRRLENLEKTVYSLIAKDQYTRQE